MEKQITIELANNHTEWGLAIRDKLCVTHSWAPLNASEVEKIIDGINAAAEAGAPWQKYVKHERR